MGTPTFSNIFKPFLASIRAMSWGVVTMTAGSGPLAGRTALSGRAISGRAISGRAVSGSRRSRAGAEIGHGLLAACLAAATAAIPLLHEPGFYFRDDAQAYFLPGFLEIARREPERCEVIQADASIDQVAQAVWDVVSNRLDL